MNCKSDRSMVLKIGAVDLSCIDASGQKQQLVRLNKISAALMVSVALLVLTKM